MEGSRTVLLIGTLDTKGDEYAYLRERLRLHGVGALLADAGTGGAPRTQPDVTREEIAAEAGIDLGGLGDRGAAVGAMAAAATVFARRLHAEGRIDGILA